ncbi:MAG: hypothetical protein DRP26_05875 [Candidatus Zixiibacteriota bacterium]|nr:MAG: hypothetical protein DRP26_05875 [candidate division Zixibacteria bacterium]
MPECQHQWEMTNIKFGFVVFEKCFHCNGLRTYFSTEDTPILGDKYREGNHFWSRVENAQSFRFDLKCMKCGHLEKFEDLMGLLYCTGCLPDCEVEILRKKYEAERTWVVVAFGFLPEAIAKPIPSYKLNMLTDYFNQRRDTSRSKIKVISFNLISDLSRCKGEFIHDVGMLSLEPPKGRKPLF